MAASSFKCGCQLWGRLENIISRFLGNDSGENCQWKGSLITRHHGRGVNILSVMLPMNLKSKTSNRYVIDV